MSRPHWARLLIGACGVVLTGLAVRAVEHTAAILAALVLGFIATSVSAEYAFSRLATRDEIRQDLEERTRAPD